MNAAEAFDQIAGIPGVSRSDAGAGGFIDGRTVSGIEFIQANPMPERSLRAAWKRRRGNTAPPLVIFTDDPDVDGNLVVLGPTKPEDPLRSIKADALVDLVVDVAALKGIRAVRSFASELVTLDATGGAGLALRGFGSEHLFRHRLPQGHGLPAELTWAALGELVAGFRGGDWTDLLRHLGYELRQRPDRGYLAVAGSRRLMVIHPVRDVSEFSRVGEQGILREGALLTDCQQEDVPVGLLAAGSRIRIYLNDDEAGALNRYLELDIEALEADLRPLLALVAPDPIQTGVFTSIRNETRDYGTGLRDRLDRSLRQEVLPVLGLELGRAAVAAGEDVEDDSVREQLEGAALTFVFRALFLLYAEGAGYLPMKHEAYRARSLTRLCRRAATEETAPGEKATTLWDDLTSVVNAMRTGKPAWGVPAYNGDLFAADGLKGAGWLERYSIPDRALAPALAALGRDSEADGDIGLDYSGLEIGHLGHIYEGLLSLRLSVAEQDLTYVPNVDRYRATPEGEEPEVRAGELTWLTHEGGRKVGGVYYTPAPLVRHLVRQSVRPAFAAHLEMVRALAETDPDRAAAELFEFHTIDPACGSAHFLVQVADELADQAAKLIGQVSLPGVRRQLEDLRATAGKTYDLEIEDAALLKRLVIKQCVFGVDISEMGVEIAKLSLWLAGFVPGLSLAYLDRNVVCGNSLVGVVDPEEVATPAAEANGNLDFFGGPLETRLRAASKKANELQRIPDRTPEEIARSREKNREYDAEVAGAERLMDIWTAAYLGHPEAKGRAQIAGPDIVEGDRSLDDEPFVQAARSQNALHWPTAFAETFSRADPGFDVVVGNPPWEEVTVEELAFYARYQPGLRGLAAGPRGEALVELKAERPELETDLEAEQGRLADLRSYLACHSPEAISAGDPDLYKYFAHRYQSLLRQDGRLGVVLPRSAFLVKGMAGFRRWLATEAPIQRVDFLLNRGRWAFDAEERMTVALLSAQRNGKNETLDVAGVGASPSEFANQAVSSTTSLTYPSLGPNLEIPLAPGRAAYDLMNRMAGTPFALGGGAWRCFPVAELHETNDRGLWRDAEDGWELWKGSSFDQYDPAGPESRPCPMTDELWAKVTKSRGKPGAGSLAAEGISLADRRTAVARTVGRSRVAFRDVSRATDSRTVRACLIPPETLLTNKAPYLTFVEDAFRLEAACLGVMNSVPFDWQARRYVETNVNFFILELLKVPELDERAVAEIGSRAARLSVPDERFTKFADACGVEVGPLAPGDALRLRAEIDALVARAWRLTVEDLVLMFTDFPETDAGVSAAYREEILTAFEELP